MLSFVPDALLYAVVIGTMFTGIALYVISFVTRFIPPLIPYSGIARILGTILTVVGIYFFGSYSTEMSWRARVSELEEQVKVSEAKSKEVNIQIQKVYVDRVKVVKQTQIVIQEKIKEVEIKIDSECKVAPEAVDILNEAAAGVKK
jgi:membrane-bound ClpP family serine protease